MMRNSSTGRATAALTALLAMPAAANAAVIYSDTFEAGDPVNYTVSPTKGDPMVVGPAGLMTTNSLELRSPNATDCTPEGSPIQYSCYDQPHYDMGGGGIYNLSFELDLSELTTSFSVITDVPFASSLRFSGDGTVYGMGSTSRSYDKDALLEVSILLDFLNGYQHVIVNGEYWAAGDYDYTAGGRYGPEFRSVRFSLDADTTGPDSAVRVDNVLMATAVPVPAAVWLFASGLGVLGWLRRRRTSL